MASNQQENAEEDLDDAAQSEEIEAPKELISRDEEIIALLKKHTQRQERTNLILTLIGLVVLVSLVFA